MRIYVKVYEGDDKRWPIIYWIEITLPECQGLQIANEVLDAEPDAYWIWDDKGDDNPANDECVWSGSNLVVNNETGEAELAEPEEETKSKDDDSNLVLYLGGGIGLLVIVLLSLFFVLRGEGDDVSVEVHMGGEFDDGYAGVAEMDPMEQYVQQLIAQGYPEETARAYAQQYAGHFQQ